MQYYLHQTIYRYRGSATDKQPGAYIKLMGSIFIHRAIKGLQVSQEVLERREKKEALAFRACPGLPAPKAHRGVLATQVGGLASS